MKGIFYSIITLLLLAPLMLLVIAELNVPQSGTLKLTGDKLVAYSKSIDDDMPRALNIMAEHALVDAVSYVETSGAPLDDSGSALAELITNGTLYGNNLSDFTINSWTTQLRNKASQYGLETQVNLSGVRFWSVDSYTIGVELSITVNATNPSAVMNLYRVYNASTLLSIEGLNDPVYTLNTNGILKRPIRRSAAVSGMPSFDTTVSGLYLPSVQGASFLDRLEGRLVTSGKYGAAGGLESVVFLPDLQANGLQIKQSQSDIDYLYFDPSNHPGSPVNQSAYSWLRIDSSHAATYNLTTL